MVEEEVIDFYKISVTLFGMNFTKTHVLLMGRVINAVNLPINKDDLKTLMTEVQEFVLTTTDNDVSNFENMTTRDARELMLFQHGHLLRVLMDKVTKEDKVWKRSKGK